MFQDFIAVFGTAAVSAMVVVLWHPGTWEEIHSSLENVNDRLRCVAGNMSCLPTVLTEV